MYLRQIRAVFFTFERGEFRVWTVHRVIGTACGRSESGAGAQRSEARAAKFPAPVQTYFCDSRSPLRDLPLRSSLFLHPLTLIQFSARSAPFSAPIPLRPHALVIGSTCQQRPFCRGATTFSKLGVQFLGLWCYSPSTEKKLDRFT